MREAGGVPGAAAPGAEPRAAPSRSPGRRRPRRGTPSGAGSAGSSPQPLLRSGLIFSFGAEKYFHQIRHLDGFFAIFLIFSAIEFLHEFGYFCMDP